MPDASSDMVCVPPGLTLYVIVALGVPVKFIVADAPGHTVASLEMAATGNGATVMVMLPETGWVQPGAPAVAMLTRL